MKEKGGKQSTLDRLVLAGKIKKIKISDRAIGYEQSEILEFIEARKQECDQ
jgi:predicted DNA-binding transcriptional regulator AlpA